MKEILREEIEYVGGPYDGERRLLRLDGTYQLMWLNGRHAGTYFRYYHDGVAVPAGGYPNEAGAVYYPSASNTYMRWSRCE